MAGLRGAQFEHQGLGCIRQLEHYQGTPAPLGVSTVLPILLAHRPRSAEGVTVFAGEAPQGAGEMQRQGIDYSVDIEARTITWLPTARKALSTTATITVRYWRRRILDAELLARGLE